MLERAVRLTLPRDEQQLLRTRASGRRSRLDAALDDVHGPEPTFMSPAAISQTTVKLGGIRHDFLVDK